MLPILFKREHPVLLLCDLGEMGLSSEAMCSAPSRVFPAAFVFSSSFFLIFIFLRAPSAVPLLGAHRAPLETALKN